MTRASRVMTWRRAFDQHGAVVKHQEAIDQPHHRMHRVLDDDDRDALLRQPAQYGDDLGRRRSGAEPGQRLVEQQETRSAGERARKLHQPQLFGGQLVRHAIGDVRQADLCDRARRPRAWASLSSLACT